MALKQRALLSRSSELHVKVVVSSSFTVHTLDQMFVKQLQTGLSFVVSMMLPSHHASQVGKGFQHRTCQSKNVDQCTKGERGNFQSKQEDLLNMS